jgi:hypothetical protein
MNPFTEIYYPQSEKWLLNSTFDEWMICLERITDMDESEYKCVAEKLEDYVTANFSNEYGTRELKQTMEELYLE